MILPDFSQEGESDAFGSGLNPDATLDLIASLAHELNNPLSVIFGFSELLLEDETSDPRVAKIHEAAERSMGIIRTVLDLYRSRIRGRAIPASSRTPVNLRTAIEQAIGICEHELQTREISIELGLRWRAVEIYSREGALTQVFLNLITNAIQAISELGRGGTILIEGKRLGPKVYLTIQDSGPGFAGELFPRLFQPCFTTKPEGTGIGLHLSREIVRSAGGDLWATHVTGRGGIFTMELPVVTPRRRAPSEADGPHHERAPRFLPSNEKADYGVRFTGTYSPACYRERISAPPLC